MKIKKLEVERLKNKRMSNKDFQTVAKALREYDKHPIINFKKLSNHETLRFNQKEGLQRIEVI